MLNKILILIFAAFALVSNGRGQSIKVFSETRQTYPFPWAGGMNSCQFGKMDLNLDGTKDLVVFDRVGDRVMPFLVVSYGNSFAYQYAPEYARAFPSLAHWAIFADYDLDGKEDIFTYSPGYAGMKVYKNVSVNEPAFRLEVFPYLTSFQGGGYVNILVTYADYPAIADLDGDSDLDILTFYGLGAFVEKHRNMSMEKFGNADSLDFEKTESCWGYFAEGIESNVITLDTCLRCGEKGRQGDGEMGRNGTWNTEHGTWNMKERHTGSTFRILDLNGDDLPDLLLGDVDYPNLVALYNGGNLDTARMTSYDWQYPTGIKPVNLFSMPATFHDDFDFDGVKDLLVSPFDPNPFLPDNFHSAWLYHNNGNNDQPQFSLVTSSFLQNQMLDFGAGAYPVFFDIDQDGLTDLLVGDYGYYDTSYYDEFLILHSEHTGQIAYLKNTGATAQPAFTLIDRDFAGISASSLKGIMPAFGDLDGDGDPDMLLGSESGWIRYYENTAGNGNLPVFEYTEEYYQGINPGAFSTPQLFDLDGDNLIDLIIGEKGGNLNLYRNYGSPQNPAFILVNDSLGKINVTDYNVSLDGYSVPHFYRDASGNTHLLLGSEQGEVFYYTGIDENIYGKYILSDTLAGLVGLQEVPSDFGYRSAPALADLDQDGVPELIVGNFSGGLNYFGKNDPSHVNQITNNQDTSNLWVDIFPNPAHDKVNISCLKCLDTGTVDILLLNHLGQAVFSFSGDAADNLVISTKGFPGGIYMIRLIFKDNHGRSTEVYSKKLVLSY
jgi:hypothetical protein